MARSTRSGDRARSVERHFWIGAGVLHGHFFAFTFYVGRRAVFLALLIYVGAVGVHIFLRDALLERHGDGDAEYFRFCCVFVLPGLHVLGGGTQARGRYGNGQQNGNAVSCFHKAPDIDGDC